MKMCEEDEVQQGVERKEEKKEGRKRGMKEEGIENRNRFRTGQDEKGRTG